MGKFMTVRARKRREKVSATMTKRWKLYRNKCLHDHGYSSSASSNHVNINNCSHEEIVETSDVSDQSTATGTDGWREGRRLVELGVLAEGLKACKQCGLPLHLHHVVKETRFGLGGYLHVQCMNIGCTMINKVPMGKLHDKMWDVNSKLAAGLLHVGIGEQQINNLFSSLNMPGIGHRHLKKREREVGVEIEKTALNSTIHALEEETACTTERDPDSDATALCVSVDGAWQTRGSGRSYNSLSGHASMVGCNTKKIIAYSSRKTSCRTCNYAKRNGTEIKPHDCRLNYSGSSKSMEADMTVSMVKDINSDEAKVLTIVGDEDSSTMHRIHKEVNIDIQKRSDSNHLKKIITNNLKKLQGQCKLSDKTIKYIIKNFNYMCHANQGNKEGIMKGLKALSAHPFGDHSYCETSWCRFIENPNAKYSALPYGRPLRDENLREKLTEIFAKYEQHPEKLANMRSTQVNENFNGIVATKAPKSHYFSGSEGLDFRLGAAVAQKNIGYGYLMNVYQRIGLSPGQYTKRVSVLRDLQNRKRKAVAVTRKAKMRRLHLKTEKSQRSASKETREGTTYASGVALQPSDLQTTEEIPKPTSKPLQELFDIRQTKDASHVYFDLEATGFGRISHITQIAAVRGDEKFSCYVMPKVPLHQKASEITGIKVIGDTMYHNDVPVDYLRISEALDAFIEFLDKTNKNLLIGHNVQKYDCPILMNALDACGKLELFFAKVIGFMDTLKLMKLTCPGEKSYSQVSLVKRFMEESYGAHDAQEDVASLQKLVKHLDSRFTPSAIEKASFSPTYSLCAHEYSKHIHINFPTLTNMVNRKTISKNIARSIAGSGLCYRHLLLAYRRNGRDGIRDIFSEKCENNHVRVTRSDKIIDTVADFFSKEEVEL